MGIFHETIDDILLIVTVFAGHVTGDAFREAYQGMIAGSDFDELVVVAKGAIIDVSIDDIRAVSGAVAAAGEADGREILCAVVLADEISEWVVKLYNDVSHLLGSVERTERFDTLDDAVAALGRTSSIDRIRETVARLGG